MEINSLRAYWTIKQHLLNLFFVVGLISDAFHMFFDCTGLVAGLAASLVSKWRANERYSYGYARAEVLAGFVNGLFLLFIAFFIMSEAVERAIEPPEVNTNFSYLFLVTKEA